MGVGGGLKGLYFTLPLGFDYCGESQLLNYYSLFSRSQHGPPLAKTTSVLFGMVLKDRQMSSVKCLQFVLEAECRQGSGRDPRFEKHVTYINQTCYEKCGQN